MRRIQYTFPTLCFSLLTFIIYCNGKRLIVCKQQHIRPFLNEWRCLGRCFLSKFQFPAVIGSQLIRLLKFPDLGMRGQHHIYTNFNHFRKLVQEASHFFFGINITISISKIFNSGFLMLIANALDTHGFSPIHRINN